MALRMAARGASSRNWAEPFSTLTPSCFQSESRSTFIGASRISWYSFIKTFTPTD